MSASWFQESGAEFQVPRYLWSALGVAPSQAPWFVSSIPNIKILLGSRMLSVDLEYIQIKDQCKQVGL